MMKAWSFEGSTWDRLEIYLQHLCPGIVVDPRLAPQPVRMTANLFSVGPVLFWKNSYSHGVDINSAAPPDNIVFASPMCGGMSLPQASELAVGKQILAYAAPEFSNVRVEPETTSQNFAVSRNGLNRRLERLLDRSLRAPLRFGLVTDASKGSPESVRIVLRGLLTAASAPSGPSHAVPSLADALIDLLLESLPHNYSDALLRPPPRVSPRAVRRAIAYMEDQPMRSLSIDDLAAVCGVSKRSLQATFRDSVGFSPGEYWRRVRCRRALQELKARPSASISEVAAAWGFTNVTRFKALCAMSEEAHLRPDEPTAPLGGWL